MTAVTAVTDVGDLGTAPPVSSVIAWSTFSRLWRQAAAVGATGAVLAVTSATTYASTYPSEASRRAMASSLAGGSGLAVVFGQVDRIGTVGGYTAYKTFVTLTTIGAIWITGAVCRLLRGDEDHGRWHLVLAGRTEAAQATRAVLAGAAAATGVAVALVVASLAALTCRADLDLDLTGCLAFGASTAIPILVFGTSAAVCAQLGRTRRVASGLAFGLVGGAFAVRMVGDAGGRLEWLLWATPFGWAELVHPFTADDLRPLVLALAAAAVLAAAACHLASGRDVGGGVLATSDTAPTRTAGLGSSGGLLVRTSAPSAAVWAGGLAALSLLFGVVARTVEDGMSNSSSASSALSDLGASGAITTQYLGVVFLLLGAVLALLPATHLGAARDEEAFGRLGLVLATAVGRRRWWLERIGFAIVSISASALLCGLGAWLGATWQGVDVGLQALAGAGANLIPAAIVALGVGTLGLALAPRAAPASIYILVAWSFVADLIGSLASGFGWVSELGLFHHVALLPADRFDPRATVVLLALGLALLAAAIELLVRRDLAGS